MRVTREIGFFSLLVIATLLVQNASATLLSLPDSSYAEAEGNWQGYRIYEEDDFYVRVEFTVYDTDNLKPGDEEDLVTALVDELDMTGQYIYAYQVWNHPTADKGVGSFQILNLDESPLTQTLDDINSYDDDSDGLKPTGTWLEGIWAFEELGEATLIAGEHSWFLVFSDDFGPIPGTFTIKSVPDFPIIPEPATIMLLGIGSALIFTRRRKSVQ